MEGTPRSHARGSSTDSDDISRPRAYRTLCVRWLPLPICCNPAGGRWYLRFALSYRDVEELLVERGVEVDHVTVYRWVQCPDHHRQL
jgi:hypothetical protein